MSEEGTVGLGQREVGVADELLSDELELLEKADVSIPLFRAVLGISNARITVNAAIGGALNILKALKEDKEIADPRDLESAPAPADDSQLNESPTTPE